MSTSAHSNRNSSRRSRSATRALIAVGLIVMALLVVKLSRRDEAEPAPLASRAPDSSSAVPAETLPVVRPSHDTLLPLSDVHTAAKLDGSSEAHPIVSGEQRFAVHVVDEDGQAVAEAWVSVGPLGAKERWLAANIDRLRELSKQTDGAAKLDAMRAVKAQLEAESQSAPPEAPTVYRSDAEGRCRFSAAGDIVVSAEKDGVGTSGEWCSAPPSLLRPREVAAGVREPGSEQQVELQLHPQAIIAGQVLDRQGEPLPNARVTAEVNQYSPEQTRPRTPEPVPASSAGRFSMRVDAPGDFELHAQAAALVTEDVHVSVEPGGSSTVVLRVPGAFAIRGRVESASGSPLGSQLILNGGGEIETAESGIDGRFEFLLTGAGGYELSALAAGLVQDVPVSVQLTTEQPEAEIVVRMLKSESISGVVLWDDGSPVEGATVEARPEPRPGRAEFSWMNTSRTRLSEGDGNTFTLDGIHPDEVYDVSAFAMQPAIAVGAAFNVLPGTRGVELVLEREAAKGHSVKGRVVDARTGTPITEYELSYGMWIRGLYNGKTKHVRDDSGRFELTGLQSFEQALVVKAEGFQPKTVGPLTRIDAADELLIRLEHLVGLVVRVVDEAGSPVPGATLRAQHAISEQQPDLFTESWTATTSSTGEATWEQMPPGRYVLQAAEGNRLSDMTFASVTEEAGAVTVLLLTAPEPGTLVVTVLDRKGQPVDAAQVSIHIMSELVPEAELTGPGAEASQDLEAMTEERGSVTFSGLPPGQYSVWPQLENAFIAPLLVVVPAGRVTEVTLSPD